MDLFAGGRSTFRESLLLCRKDKRKCYRLFGIGILRLQCCAVVHDIGCFYWRSVIVVELFGNYYYGSRRVNDGFRW